MSALGSKSIDHTLTLCRYVVYSLLHFTERRIPLKKLGRKPYPNRADVKENVVIRLEGWVVSNMKDYAETNNTTFTRIIAEALKECYPCLYKREA